MCIARLILYAKRQAEGPMKYLRQTELAIQELPDGGVVYRESPSRAIFLNPAAFLILLSCDGQSTNAEIAELVKEGFGLSFAPSTDVEKCIQLLLSEGLVTAMPLDTVDTAAAKSSATLKAFLRWFWPGKPAGF
jgi:hypothetical protein